MKKCITFIFLLVFSFSLFFAQTSSEPYSPNEFQPWMYQLRRSEIITLGSLPFTTLTTSLAYSFYRYALNDFHPDYTPNPFSPSQASLSTDEQKQILYISLSASLLVGLIDFTISMIKQHKTKEAIEKKETPYTIKKIVIEDESE